jgi:hypothetical protein
VAAVANRTLHTPVNEIRRPLMLWQCSWTANQLNSSDNNGEEADCSPRLHKKEMLDQSSFIRESAELFESDEEASRSIH